MRGTRPLGLALVVLSLGAAPAIAQQSNAGGPANTSTPPTTPMARSNMPAAKNANPPAATAENTNASGPTGSLEKYNGDWRTSKVVGATVFNDKGASIGTVNDLLMGDDGKVSQVIVSTGAVLGIGGKLVAVPFDQVKFEPSVGNNNAAAAPATNTPANNTTAANGNAATTNANTPAANTTNTAANGNPPATNGNVTAANNAPAANNAHPTQYSVVLPDATKDSLQKEQAFKFAGTD
jgi:sporulation protein YlmC with PRC-barrel domain